MWAAPLLDSMIEPESGFWSYSSLCPIGTVIGNVKGCTWILDDAKKVNLPIYISHHCYSTCQLDEVLHASSSPGLSCFLCLHKLLKW
jgi:hypothetical protein